MGGPVAQQIARSILMRGADKIVNNAYEAELREEEKHRTLADTPPDRYRDAFLTAGFETITPSIEALPASAVAVNNGVIDLTGNLTDAKPIQAQATRLIHVEVWNLIIGDEKMMLLEKVRSLGAEVPPKDDWQRWRVATGAPVGEKAGEKNKPITFLIPPDMGRIGSGDRAVVEMVELDQMHVARYAAN